MDGFDADEDEDDDEVESDKEMGLDEEDADEVNSLHLQKLAAEVSVAFWVLKLHYWPQYFSFLFCTSKNNCLHKVLVGLHEYFFHVQIHANVTNAVACTSKIFFDIHLLFLFKK